MACSIAVWTACASAGGVGAVGTTVGRGIGAGVGHGEGVGGMGVAGTDVAGTDMARTVVGGEVGRDTVCGAAGLDGAAGVPTHVPRSSVALPPPSSPSASRRLTAVLTGRQCAMLGPSNAWR